MSPFAVPFFGLHVHFDFGMAELYYPLIATGLIMTSEGSIYLTVEYGLEIDTSDLPMSVQVFSDIWKGLYENWPDDPCIGPLYPRTCPK